MPHTTLRASLHLLPSGLRRLRARRCGHVLDAPLGPVAFALARHVLALSLLADIVDVLLELARRRSRRLLLLLRPSSGAHRHCQVGVVRGGHAAICLSPRSARQPGRQPGRQLGAQLRLALSSCAAQEVRTRRKRFEQMAATLDAAR